MTKEAPIIDLDSKSNTQHGQTKKKDARGTRAMLALVAAAGMVTTSGGSALLGDAMQRFRDTRHSTSTEYMSPEHITTKVAELKGLFNDTIANHPDAFISDLSGILPLAQQGKTITYWRKSDDHDSDKVGTFYDITLITTRPTTPDEQTMVLEIDYDESLMLSDDTIQEQKSLRLLRTTVDPNTWFLCQDGRWFVYPYPSSYQIYLISGQPVSSMTRDDFENFSAKVEVGVHAASGTDDK